MLNRAAVLRDTGGRRRLRALRARSGAEPVATGGRSSWRRCGAWRRAISRRRPRPGAAARWSTSMESFNRMAEELRRSREQLARAQRVAAWSDVARVLSHEIKNSLQPIQMAIPRVRRRLEHLSGADRQAVEDSLDGIREEAESLGKMASTFSEFARLPDPEPMPVDVNGLLRSIGRAARSARTGSAARPRARGARRCTSIRASCGAPSTTSWRTRSRRSLGRWYSDAVHTVAVGTLAASRDDPRERHRARHSAGDPGPDLRTVLHDARHRHRPRARARGPDRHAKRRPHRGGERTGPRRHLHAAACRWPPRRPRLHGGRS